MVLNTLSPTCHWSKCNIQSPRFIFNSHCIVIKDEHGCDQILILNQPQWKRPETTCASWVELRPVNQSRSRPILYELLDAIKRATSASLSGEWNSSCTVRGLRFVDAPGAWLALEFQRLALYVEKHRESRCDPGRTTLQKFPCPTPPSIPYAVGFRGRVQKVCPTPFLEGSL